MSVGNKASKEPVLHSRDKPGQEKEAGAHRKMELKEEKESWRDFGSYYRWAYEFPLDLNRVWIGFSWNFATSKQEDFANSYSPLNDKL